MLHFSLLCSWLFSRFSTPIHWLVYGHMTSNNETVSRQTPWAGNIAKTVTSNGKQFIVTHEMLTAVARHLSMTWLFFHRFDPFALLYNKSLNDWSLGELWILFPSNLNVSLDFVSGNIEILRKQNSLFPSGPVIKCLLSIARTITAVIRHLHVASWATYCYKLAKKYKNGMISIIHCCITCLLDFARRHDC